MLSGVQEYWIIDQKQGNILIYCFDNFELDKYKTFEPGNVAKSSVFSSLSADISAFFHELIG